MRKTLLRHAILPDLPPRSALVLVAVVGRVSRGPGAAKIVATTVAGAATEAATEAAAAAETTATSSEISGSTRSAAKAAAATTTAATTATVRGLSRDLDEEIGNLLASFGQKRDHVFNNDLVVSVEERSGDTNVTSTTGTTDSMNVIINVRGQVIVDNVLNIGDIQTSGGDCSGNQDWSSTVLESSESLLSLVLRSITVDGSGGETLVIQEVSQVVSHPLCLCENNGQAKVGSGQQVQNDRSLLIVFDEQNFLSDVG